MTGRWLAAGLLLALSAFPVQGQRLLADLSSKEIAITTGFTGAELLLFGATEGVGDIVVTVVGPRREEVVRRKERIAGIWVNGTSMTFRRTPAYYRVASSRPLADIAPPGTLSTLQIGTGTIRPAANEAGRSEEIRAFREALVRNKMRLALYGEGDSDIRIVGGRLFRTTIPFPANVPTGEYLVTVYLFEDGELVSAEETPLSVRRVGLEAQIFNFAHERSAWYGAIAILIALMAGWLAGVIFRRA